MPGPRSPLITTLRLLRTLAPADALNFSRDALLMFLVALPVPLALTLRFQLPRLEAMLEARLAFDLALYHPMIMAIFLGMAPSLIGSVYGLALVEERDERTLAALRVTPAPFGAYLAARMATPTALSIVLTIVTYPLTGLTPLPLHVVATIALSAASVAPVAALAIVVFAPNKVAGLVAFRLVNIALALPAIAYVASPGWERAAWAASSYWPMKAVWLAADGRPFLLTLLIAPVMNALMTLWLYGRFMRRNEP